MSTLKSMGDLRVFLADTMDAVREGTLDAGRAGQIAKLASQINASVHAEIAARVHLKLDDVGSFNDLTLVRSKGILVGPKLTSAKQTENRPDELDAEDTEPDEVAGTRHPNQKLSDADWPQIKILLNKNRYSVTKVAGLYNVEFTEMRRFIDEHQ
jgi:hypothetical protein